MADPQNERLQRLEENQGFAERAMDELSAEVLALSKRVQELSMKLARLEARFDAAQTGREQPEEGDQTRSD